mgnify:CR=1 FL=1
MSYEEERIAKSKAVSLSFVYDGITIEESETIISKLSTLLDEEKPKLRKMYGADQLVAQENRS